jgi:hypothetical protein
MGVISADFRIEEAQANANVHGKPSPVGSATSGALPERGYEGVVVAKIQAHRTGQSFMGGDRDRWIR